MMANGLVHNKSSTRQAKQGTSKTSEPLASEKVVLLEITAMTRRRTLIWSLCAPLCCYLFLSAIAAQVGAVTFIKINATSSIEATTLRTTGETISGQRERVAAVPTEPNESPISHQVDATSTLLLLGRNEDATRARSERSVWNLGQEAKRSELKLEQRNSGRRRRWAGEQLDKYGIDGGGGDVNIDVGGAGAGASDWSVTGANIEHWTAGNQNSNEANESEETATTMAMTTTTTATLTTERGRASAVPASMINGFARGAPIDSSERDRRYRDGRNKISIGDANGRTDDDDTMDAPHRPPVFTSPIKGAPLVGIDKMPVSSRADVGQDSTKLARPTIDDGIGTGQVESIDKQNNRKVRRSRNSNPIPSNTEPGSSLSLRDSLAGASYLNHGDGNDQLSGQGRGRQSGRERLAHDTIHDDEATSEVSSSTLELLSEQFAELEAEEATHKLKCRVEKDLYLDFEEYRHYTCANCYNQVPPENFKNKLALDKEERFIRLFDREADSGEAAFVWVNETDRIRQTFKDGEKYAKWQICCQQAVACCRDNAKHLPRTSNSLGQLIDDPERTECPGTWDGLSCWPPSASGQLAWHICPREIYFLDFEPACRGYVTKQCFQNASWFINRKGHEWSDYSDCSGKELYKARMLHATVAYICEALVVIPALFIIGKFPNRGGNKRIKIMKNLLFCLLIKSLIQASQRGFLAKGFFAEYRNPTKSAHHSASVSAAPPSASSSTTSSPPLSKNQQALVALLSSSNISFPKYQDGGTNALAMEFSNEKQTAALSFISQQTPTPGDSRSAHSMGGSTPSDNKIENENRLIEHLFSSVADKHETRGQSVAKAETLNGSGHRISVRSLEQPSTSASTGGISNSVIRGKQTDSSVKREENTTTTRRYKRNPSNQQQPSPIPGRGRRNESAWTAFFCWLLQIAERLFRLMSYAWMFTGGVYLCSALHFAPAEPPANYIKVLFFLTNAYPILIFFAYVTARTINEPSPLNLLIRGPYYWLIDDEATLDDLYATQKVCWFEASESERIEKIADMPNIVLVILNVFIFVITLIILCRINRPGSTRPDMSPFAYFRAAGTLLFLYGGHFLIYHKPQAETCSWDTFLYYASMGIDVVQGIAIPIVFCYTTQEGRAVIAKYWRTRNRFLLIRQCNWMGCLKDKDKFEENGYHHATKNNNNSNRGINRVNQSTRSSSGCNGHCENVTELININDT